MEPFEVLREHRRSVIRYWERRRWLYLGVLLLASAAGYLPGVSISAGVGDVAVLSPGAVLLLFGFAFVMANACYSVVYLIEFWVMGTKWQEVLYTFRGVLLIAGCVLGAVLALSSGREIYWAEFGQP